MGASAPVASALAQFRVEISGVGATQIPIAIARFRDEGRCPVALSAVIQADLERSGLFKAIDAGSTPIDDASKPALSDWKSRGVDALVGGSVTQLADGRWDVRYHLWDALKGKDLGGLSQAVHPGDLRLMAHRIADDIYEKLTGDRGAFATRIAYVSKVGKQHQLIVADADGEGAQVPLASSQPIISPAWSPDGRNLAYVSFETGKPVVIVHDVASGRRRVVAGFKGSNSAPAWSPDGRQLAVTLSRDGGSQIHILDVEGGGTRRLTQSSAIDTEATWSPDGATLYFVSDRGGSPQIYRVPVAGGGAQRVTFSGSYNISPAISPDGRWLAYVGQVERGYKVHVMDLSSGQVKAITGLRAQQQATHLRHPAARPGSPHDQHPRRPHQGQADHPGLRCARAGLGSLPHPATLTLILPGETHATQRSSLPLPLRPAGHRHRRRRAAWRLWLERQAR
jgi:TolB protein